MLAIKTLVASALLALTVPSFAAPVVLDFENAPLAATRVLDSYDSLGISFSANAWAAQSAAFGGAGNFYGTLNNADSRSNKGAVFLSSNPLSSSNSGPLSFTISIADGFDDFFSLIYAGAAATTITAYDRAGTAVKSVSGSAPGICNGNFACNWSKLELRLDGTDVYSVTVSGTDSRDWYDDITFGNLLPASGPGPINVPEPSGVALSLAALGALAWSRKRTKS